MDKSVQNGLGARPGAINAHRKSLFYPKYWEGADSVGVGGNNGSDSYKSYYPVAKGMKLWNRIPGKPMDAGNVSGASPMVKTPLGFNRSRLEPQVADLVGVSVGAGSGVNNNNNDEGDQGDLEEDNIDSNRGIDANGTGHLDVDYNYTFAHQHQHPHQHQQQHHQQPQLTRDVLAEHIEVMSIDESPPSKGATREAVAEKIQVPILNENLDAVAETLGHVLQPISLAEAREQSQAPPPPPPPKPQEYVAPRPHYGKGTVNPFSAFATKQVLTAPDVVFIRGALNSGLYSEESLLKYFKQVLSPPNDKMLTNIITVFTDYMQSNHKMRPLIIRLFYCALAFCPDDFVQAYHPNLLHGLFTPEVDDDIGGSFIRMLLNYRSVFNSPGSSQAGLPIAIDSNGHVVYRQADVAVADDSNADPSDVDVSSGKIETLVMLTICMQRARVKSAFDLPSSRLRDWLCSIWYELPSTRPRMPLVTLCLHWIDSRVDDELVKDGAFALLCDHIQRLNAKDEAMLAAAGLGVSTFLGTKVLLMHFINFCFCKGANVHPQLERLLELLTVNEDDLYIALDAIVAGWSEVEMLDLWCCLCMIPWIPSQMPSPLVVLMATLLRTYFSIAIQNAERAAVVGDAPEGESEKQVSARPSMGLIENCIRVAMCRASSPLVAHVALFQSMYLIATGQFAILSTGEASALLKSLPQMMFKYFFLWSHVKDCVDASTLQLMQDLYGMVSLVVECKPLTSIADLPMHWTNPSEPLFPRVQQKPPSSSGHDTEADFFPKSPPLTGSDYTQVYQGHQQTQHQQHQHQHHPGTAQARVPSSTASPLSSQMAYQPSSGRVPFQLDPMQQRPLAASPGLNGHGVARGNVQQMQVPMGQGAAASNNNSDGNYCTLDQIQQSLYGDSIPAGYYPGTGSGPHTLGNFQQLNQAPPVAYQEQPSRTHHHRRRHLQESPGSGPLDYPPDVENSKHSPRHRRPSPRNVCGLRNIGNTCYFNSMIQALYHTRFFVHCLESLNIEGDLARSLRKLFSRLASRKEAFSPSSTISLLPDHLNNGQQQDVTEFYRFLLESVDPSNKSGIWTKVFAGLTVQHIRCMRCRSVSSKESTIYDFTLCTNNSSLRGLFKSFCKRERLSGENKYNCDVCKKKQNAEMWVEIASPPAHIIVILGRNMGFSGEKDTSRVMLEPELEVGSFLYRIYGAIFHSGATSNSGHYYFIGCDSESLDRWHRFNDSDVVPIDPDVLIRGNWDSSHVPYVVFYRCLEAPPTPQLEK